MWVALPLLFLPFILIAHLSRLIRLVRGFLLRLESRGKPRKWKSTAVKVIGDLEIETERHGRCLWPSMIYTVLVWGCLLFLFHEVMRLTGNPTGIAETIVGSSFANGTQLLPINTFGSFGSLEAGWTFGFALMGVPAAAAFASGLVLHVMVVLFLLVSASLGWFWLSFVKPRQLR
jgi:uncharacterized membrane protein YbhN (UPF0104 family)